MADLLELSARIIDENRYEGPGSVNRTTTELSEVAEGIAVIEAFSHVVAFDGDDGLVLFDTSLEAFSAGVLKSLRGWSSQALHSIVYTHGHVDHVGGTQALLDQARQRGDRRPRVIAHEKVDARFDRYQLTNGYNAVINARQFGGALLGADSPQQRFGPASWVRPDITFRDRMRLRAGDLDFELRHARGETDDHLWGWLPAHRAICAGDFIIWVCPNAGNPQKVQRYPLEWAAALREMQALGAELLLPAHGLPIGGAERVSQVIDETATVLELLVAQTLDLMNQGARLDAIIHSVELPGHLMERPYLRPAYDEPEFVIRNIWRLYGGWYDGNPANLKPAPDSQLGQQLAALAGGVASLIERARQLADSGELRLACQIIELATQAEPENREAHAARAEIYTARRSGELSLMARGIYGHAARESEAIASGASE